MTAPRQRFDNLVGQIPLPPLGGIERRAIHLRRRRRSGRAAATAVAVVAVVAVLPLTRGHHQTDQSVVPASTPTPGSPGMPADFVADDEVGSSNSIDLVNSTTGAVVRVLYQSPTFSAMSVGTKDAYIATSKGVFALPLSGAKATRLSGDNANTIALSPDGDQLAWGNGFGVTGPEGRVGVAASITVLNLATGALRSWTLSPANAAFTSSASLQLVGLGWRSDGQIAGIMSPLPRSVMVCSRSALTHKTAVTVPWVCTNRTTTTQPGAASSRLVLIDTQSTLPTQSLTIPGTASFTGGGIENQPLVIPGTVRGTLVAAEYPGSDPQGPGRLVRLAVTSDDRVTVAPIAWPVAGQAVSFDPDGRDLLSLVAGPPNVSQVVTIERSTDGHPPVAIGPPRLWFAAAW